MDFSTRKSIRLHVALISLACATPLFAAAQSPATPVPWPGWHATPWPAFWWVIPLMFFVMIIVMFIFMMRRGGTGCAWRDRMTERPEFGDAMRRAAGAPPESALEILNKRYAKGEIDKREYEEKRAAITRLE